jgi:hypothetical protein
VPVRDLGGERVRLGTFNSPEEAAHAYDAACWGFSRDQEWLNYPDVESWEEAEFLTPLTNLQMRQDQAHHERTQLKVEVTEANKR